MEKPSAAARIATLGPLGRSPLAPGTTATLLAGIPCAALLGSLPFPLGAILVFAVTLGGVVVAERAEVEMKCEDPQEVVIDELAGYLVTMAAVEPSLINLLAGFVLFRVFDIWKPWPADALQTRLKGGLAIVMDDVAAGLYGMGCLLILDRFWA